MRSSAISTAQGVAPASRIISTDSRTEVPAEITSSTITTFYLTKNVSFDDNAVHCKSISRLQDWDLQAPCRCIPGYACASFRSQPPMIKIVSANLNGVRSAARKGFFEWMKKHDPDIVC